MGMAKKRIMYVKKNNKRRSFSRRKQSKAELFFMIYGILSFIAFIGLLTITYQGDGTVNLYLSGMGLLIYLVTIASFIGAIVKMSKLHTIRLLPTCSLIVNAMAVFGWTAVYFIGLFVL